jgi:hypothetical protein
MGVLTPACPAARVLCHTCASTRRSGGAAESAENRPLEPFILPPERGALDWAAILHLKDSTDAGQTRRRERAVVHCKTDDDGDKTEDQPPGKREEKYGPDCR